MAIDFGPIQSIGNIFANSLKYFQNSNSGTPSGDLSKDVNFLAAVAGVANMIAQAKALDPTGITIFSNLLNKFNVGVQLGSLQTAMSNGDNQKIASGFLGLISAVAGVVGAIPGFEATPWGRASPSRAHSSSAPRCSFSTKPPAAWTRIRPSILPPPSTSSRARSP